MRHPREVAVDRLEAPWRERIEALLDAAIPAVAPAAAISVRAGGELLYEAVLGDLEPGRSELPARTSARFDLASLTKLFTATALLGSASEGRVELDAPVVTVIPELAAGCPRGVDGGQEPLSRRTLTVPAERAGWRVDTTSVTFRQLLSHTGGLAPWRSVFEVTGPMPPPPGVPDPLSASERHAAGIAAVTRYAFVDQPGRTIHYSDLGFMLLGEVVMRLTGTPLDVAVRARVTGPLGLGSAGYRPLDAGVSRDSVVPTSVDELWRGRRCWGEVEDENCAGLGGVAGHAGLFAAAGDVARFGQAWLEHDPRLGIAEGLLDEAVREQARGDGERRGLGWQLAPLGHSHSEGSEGGFLAALGKGAFGHTGFTGTSLAVDPGRRLVVALLTNRVHAGRTHAGIEELRLSLHALLAEMLPPA